MRVTVEFHDEAREHATVTMVPSWLGRLLGKRPRVTHVKRWSNGWEYAVDGKIISGDLKKILDESRRWQEQSELPAASLVRRKVSRTADHLAARDLKVLVIVVGGGGILELLHRLGVL